MKHIKKRFFFERKSENIEFDQSKFEVISLDDSSKISKLGKSENQIAFIETDNNLLYGGFVHRFQGKTLVLPVPDPTLIYFSNAQMGIAHIKKYKDQLIEKVDFTKLLNESSLNEIYHYYGVTSGFVIFLFTAIESFVNQLIPDTFIFEKELSRKTESYSKSQIQEFLDFKTKITEVLKQATGQNFFNKQTAANQHIWNLKEFRDEIIHTKPDDSPLKYQKLIKKSLKFKYEDTLEAVAKFMNFYRTGYIVECDCGADF